MTLTVGDTVVINDYLSIYEAKVVKIPTDHTGIVRLIKVKPTSGLFRFERWVKDYEIYGKV